MQEHQKKVPRFARAEFSKEETMNFDPRYMTKQYVAVVQTGAVALHGFSVGRRQVLPVQPTLSRAGLDCDRASVSSREEEPAR